MAARKNHHQKPCHFKDSFVTLASGPRPIKDPFGKPYLLVDLTLTTKGKIFSFVIFVHFKRFENP